MKWPIGQIFIRSFIGFKAVKTLQYTDAKDKEQLIKRVSENRNSKPITIFYVGVWSYIGGIETMTTALANALAHKYKIILIARHLDESAYEKKIEKTNLTIDEEIDFIEVPCLNAHEAIFDIIKFVNPDVFIGFRNLATEEHPLYPKLRQENIKSIACFIDYYFFLHNLSYPPEYIFSYNKAISQADAIVVINEFNSKMYSSMSKKIIKIPCPNTFPKQKDISFCNNRKNLLVVGRLYDARKRLDLLLKTFKKVLQKEKDAKLLLVGQCDLNLKIQDDSAETIGELIKQLDFEDSQITFFGKVDDLHDVYNKGDIFLMTSDNEGFGLVLAEAASFGLPLISFRISGPEDIIIDGENGFLVEKGNLDEMAEKIVYLLRNDEEREKMAKKSQSMNERFTIEKVSKEWDNLISAVIKGDAEKYLKDNVTEEILSDHFGRLVVNEYEKFTERIMQQKNQEIHSLQESSQSKIHSVQESCQNQIQNYGNELANYKKAIEDYEQEIEQIRKSWSFRIGRTITKTISAPIDIFKNKAKSKETKG